MTPCETALRTTPRLCWSRPDGSIPMVNWIRRWMPRLAAQCWAIAIAALRRAMPALLVSDFASTSMSSLLTWYVLITCS